MPAVNKRIPETTYRALLEGNMQLVLYNPANDSTEHTLISDMIDLAPDGLEWNDITTYPINIIKSFEGNLWRSLQNSNLNNPPQVNDPDNPMDPNPWWVQITQSQSGGLWAAGAFLDANVNVYYNLDDILQQFFLVNTTRPFNSTDIQAEWAAGDWLRVGDPLGIQAADNSGAICILDFMKSRKGVWRGLTNVDHDFEIQFDNDDQALEFDLHLVFSAPYGLTFPTGTKMKNSAEWDTGTTKWTPLYAGAYSLRGRFDGIRFRIDQSGEDPYV